VELQIPTLQTPKKTWLQSGDLLYTSRSRASKIREQGAQAMPVTVSYPGVYIEEIPSGVRTITGVATSVAAFVDFFAAGPMNRAVEVLSFADFERKFGGLDIRSEASYGVQQFFLNGGSQAFCVRTTSNTATKSAVAAAIALEDSPAGATLLTATASSEGTWGNNVRVEVDFGTADPATQFNLTVTEVSVQGATTKVVSTESFRNLVIDPAQANDAAAVVTAGSQLIGLTEASGSTGKRPAQTGTVSAASPDPTSVAKSDTMDVSLNGTKLGTTAGLPAAQTTLAGLAAALQTLIAGVDPKLSGATVSVVGSASTKTWLVVKAGTGAPADFIGLGDGGSGIATKLGFAAKGQNVQQYVLGGGVVQAQGLPGASAQPGTDGTWDASTDAAGMTGGLIGDPNLKTGIYALLDVDLFNILCIPATMNLPDPNAAAVSAKAVQLGTQRRAMYVIDAPQTTNRDSVDGIKTWLDANASLRSRNAALYFPRVDIADPLNGFRLRPTAPSGTIAGLYALIDATRGVWKAPAGTEASLAGVQKLEYKLTDGENGILNPLGINCLRVFPIYGPVCWGARTLFGADQMADDYKYVPVRRLALFIEESLFRGTQWVVFEPNDEPLWSQIRLNVGAFMHNLFRQGAFQGQTPKDAYFVKCDKDTTTQNDINLGIVNIIVGFAPLKPAEFVVIQIQQIAGQIVS
jgi:phage tail sheath protein FI